MAIMRPRNQRQFQVMIDFMERHGNVDLCLRDETVQVRSKNVKKWEELTDILNSKFKNDAKSLEKWRKAWCDFKNNTAKKYVKLRQKGGALTVVEERVLQILAGNNKKKYCTKHMIDMEGQKKKNVLEPDSCEGDSSHSLTASTLPDIFCNVIEMPAAPRTRNNSFSSQASCSSSKHASKKENVDDMNHIADQFLEYESERETAIMRSKKCNQGQYMIMVEFMERHGGDLLCGGDTTTVQIQRKNCEKWEELTDILNSKFKNNTKSQEKWRKTWTDFKNNTKRKYKRLRQKGGTLTDVEERVLRLLAGKIKKNNSTKHMIDMEGPKIKIELEPNSCEGDSSHSLTASALPDIFCDVTEMNAAPRTRNNSSSSQASCSSSTHSPKKRKENVDDMNDIADRFLECGRETEIMRIKTDTQRQCMVMMEFMKQHGDLCDRDQTKQVKRKNNRKWEELAEILNSKFKKDAKSLEKWRKTWTDFKNNTKKKYEKLRQRGGALTLTDAEKRVLQMMARKYKKRKIKNVLETDSCEGDSSHSLTASTLPDIFCDVTDMPAAPRTRNNSSSLQASCSSSRHPPKKAKENANDMDDITDRFLEFERETEIAIMRLKSDTQGQCMVIMDFMERHGDLCNRDLTPQEKRKNSQKWETLSDILNNKFKNDAKSQEKWRKTWSDFKNNTKKKYKRLRQKGGTLTDAEERVLRMMAENNKQNNSTKHMTDMEGQTIKIELEPDSCEDDSSHSLTASALPDIFCDVTEMNAAPRTRNNSSSSQASCSSSTHSPKERKENVDDMNDFTDRFLEFERKREKMANERELARIKQHDQLLSVLNRMVNVLETLAPSIQKFLDHSNSHDG